MANAIYPKWKSGLMAGITAPSANITGVAVVKAALINTTSVTYNSAHWLHANISAGIVGTPVALTNKTIGTVSAATFDADNVAFTAVSGGTASAVILYIDSGTSATSNLVAYIDTGVTGLPVVTNGGNINLNWDVNGIFTL